MVLSTPEFWAAFLALLRVHSPEQLDPNLRTPITPQSEVVGEYDFIIAGAGSAGCVLANRLTENPDWKVLLIEAGSNDDYVTDTPFLAEFLTGTERDWNYTTVPQEKACLSYGGVCQGAKGRIIGGCSSLNWMMYNRGNREDYDKWKQLGNRDWGYEQVLPYFIKSENMTEPSFADSKLRGKSGPLNVQYPKFVTPMRKEYVKAGQELGWRFADYNEGDQRNLIDYLQYTMNGPLRENTAKAYLNPARDRENLHVVLDSAVSKVIIENKTARGVEYHRDGSVHRVLAKKDVILSTGAIETPKLLMLSGIGPNKHLEEHDIDVVMDLPVGKLYQDHINVPVFFELDDKASTVTERVWKTNQSILAYAKHKEGPLTMAAGGTEAVSFFNPLKENEAPSVQTIYSSAAPVNKAGNRKILRTWVINIDPLSTGTVKLRSRDFRDPPLLDPKIFSKYADKEVLEKGIEKVFEFMESKTMSKYKPRLFTENVQKCRGKSGKDYTVCVVSEYTELTNRPFGTARMGPRGDEDAVISSEDLFVKGVKGLRVVDASIMPGNPGANTNAPVIMIAEKSADIIKRYYENENHIRPIREEEYDYGCDETSLCGGEDGEDMATTEPEQQGQSAGQMTNHKPSLMNYFINKFETLLKPHKRN